MTTPSLTSLLKSALRFWYVPILTALAVLGLAWLLPESEAPEVTAGDVLFTVATADPGQDAEGTARIQENSLSVQRLGAYSSVISRSDEWQAALEQASVEVPAPSLTNTVTRKDDRLTVTPGATGLLTVRLQNKDLPADDALALVGELQRILADQVMSIDARQDAPSFTSRPLVLPAKAASTEEPTDPSLLRDVVLPVMVGLFLGLGIVFLLDWRYRRIEDRRDLEERLQVGVLGESANRPGDFDILAQSLRRGSEGPSVALIAAAPGCGTPESTIQGITQANEALGIPAVVTKVAATQGGGTQGPAEPVGRVEQASGVGSETISGNPLTLVDLTDPRGVHRELVALAPTADVVAILVQYGRTPMRELESMLIRLSDVSDTPLRVIGVRS